MHALLARLPEIAPGKRRAIALRYLAAHDVPSEDAAGLVDETLAVLDEPAFAAAFAPGGRVEVAIVAELPELGPGARINGRIDRLAVTADEVLAIDFKTNRPPPTRPEDVPALYRAQMALYRAALAKVFPGRRIACALVWTEGPKLMPLDSHFWTRKRRVSVSALTLGGCVPRFRQTRHIHSKGSFMSAPVKITDASFQNDVLNSKKPVVVDFWAEWCGPCRMIAPALEELAGELEGKITVAKINIDENPNVPQKYGVRGVPTLMIFHQGQVAATKVGALPKSKISEWIEASITGTNSAVSR